MNAVSAPMTALSFLVLVLSYSPICVGQDKRTSFFDPDETKARSAQVLDALKLICPRGEISRDQQGNIAGCRQCPRQTAEGDERDLDWSLKRTFSGPFITAEEDNLLLTGRGCEPHSMNFGGTFVFSVEGSAVSFLRYEEALITEKCHKFQIEGAPDILVCTDDWGAQVTSWSYVYAVEFDREGRSKVSRIFETMDMSRQKCGINFFDDSPTFIQESHITGLEFSTSNGRPRNLYVTASFGQRNPTDEERRACQQGKPIPLALKTYRLEFFFDGRTFQPAEKSKAALKLFPKAESPRESHAPKH